MKIEQWAAEICYSMFSEDMDGDNLENMRIKKLSQQI